MSAVKAPQPPLQQQPPPHVFLQTLNPMRGKMEWKPQPLDYDYKQEVARAAFADMLHDTERNHLYYVGLEAAIKKKRKEGAKVHVLDIGTGTGLLSMMAVRLGADTVTAIEEFAPMANCAEKVTRLNGCWDRINLIRKRSTAVLVGPGPEADMSERANILVTEVFDTELIGEGAISTFNHAHKHLLTSDCEVVPCEATVYVQPVESDLADRWNNLRDIVIPSPAGGEITIPPPPECQDETGNMSSLALHDVQMTQLKTEWFSPLTDPIPVFKFDFGAKSGGRIPKCEQTVRSAQLLPSHRNKSNLKTSAVLMWWDIWMDPEKTVLLSCAPEWAHPSGKELPWRDHWMQAIYYPLSRCQPDEDSSSETHMTVVSNHDEYSYWFDVWRGDHQKRSLGEGQGGTELQLPMPDPAGSGIHMAVSRSRLGQINDPSRNRKFAKAINTLLEDHFKETCESSRENLNVLCLSEQSLLPVIFAAVYESKVKQSCNMSFPVAKVHVCSKSDGANTQMNRILDQYFANSGFKHSRLIRVEADTSELSTEHLPNKVDIVLGEPNFSFSLLPWHNLFYWYTLNSLWKEDKLRPKWLLPQRATLWALPVHYKDLWKIRAPVEYTEGFNLQPFDDLIMNSSDGCDENVEPQPLWEYPCTALGEPKALAHFEFSEPIQNLVKETLLPFKKQDNLDVNGMALWVDWHLAGDVVVTTGPVDPVVTGKPVSWDVHSKQGVHLFPKHHRAFIQNNKDCSDLSEVRCKLTLDAIEGDISFDFTVV